VTTARTALSTVLLVKDGSVAQVPAPASIAPMVAGGCYVPSPAGGPSYATLIVTNSGGASATVTVRGGGSGLTEAGTANPGSPFTEATSGDLVTSVAAGGTAYIGPFSSDRFTQASGAAYIDFSSGASGTIVCLLRPHTAALPQAGY
jgi:hypothetical protein